MAEFLKDFIGPLLFLLYVNDIPEALSDTTTYLYAKDTSIFTPCPSAPLRCAPVASQPITLFQVSPRSQVLPPRQ